MKQTTHTKSRLSRKSVIALVLLTVLMLVLLTGCMNQNAKAEEIDISELSPEVSFTAFDYVKLPFSYLLRWLYDFTGNYGLALIVFGILVKILLFPTAAMSKKSMMKMSRLTPQVKALEAKYGDDKQKYQEEVNKLYKQEGAGGCTGCLWSLLPMLILIPLYRVICQPITWLMFHGNISPAQLGELQNVFIQAAKAAPEGSVLYTLFQNGSLNGYYWQVVAMPHIGELLDSLRAVGGSEIITMNTRLLGVELATIPQLMFWQYFNVNGVWNSIGQFLLPLLSGGINLVSMWISQKMNNSVVVNKDGEFDEEMAKKNSQTNQMMTYMMPLFSVYIGFIAPAGLSLYWITQGALSVIQDYFLTKHYKQVYDEEDRIKQEKKAKEDAEEAERERIRAEKRAQNPDGITENTSKKRLEQKQRQEQAAKEAAYQAKLREQAGEQSDPVSDETRPFRRGRAYDPNRFGEKSEDTAENTDDTDNNEE